MSIYMCRASVARLKGGNLLSSPLPTAHRNWHLPKPPLESLQWINIALAKIKLLKTFISLKHLSPLAKTSDIKSKSNHTVQITWTEVQGILILSCCLTKRSLPTFNFPKASSVPAMMHSTAAPAQKSLCFAVPISRQKYLLSGGGVQPHFL